MNISSIKKLLINFQKQLRFNHKWPVIKINCKGRAVWLVVNLSTTGAERRRFVLYSRQMPINFYFNGDLGN
jgi:hypothetical protein